MAARMERYMERSLSISLSVFCTTLCIGAVDIRHECELYQVFGGHSESTVFGVDDPPEYLFNVVPCPIFFCYLLG